MTDKYLFSKENFESEYQLLEHHLMKLLNPLSRTLIAWLKEMRPAYLKFFPESLFGLLRVVCYFVELSYPVLNVGGIYSCGIEGLSLSHWDKQTSSKLVNWK